MAQEINLVPEVSQEEVKKSVYKRKSNVVALISLLVVVAVIMGLFGVQLFLVLWGRKLDSDSSAAEKEILSQTGKDITHRSLVEKLEQAGKFLADRTTYSVVFSNLIGVLQESGASLKEGKFDSNGTTSVSGEASSSDVFSKFIEAVATGSARTNFGSVQLVSLTGSSGKPYTFTVGFTFQKQGQDQNKAGNP